MDVEGRNDLGPDKPLVVVIALGEDRHKPCHTNTVGTHGDGDELAVLIENLKTKSLRVFAPQLEYVPDFHAPGGNNRTRAIWGLIACAHFGDINNTIWGEVSAAHQVEHMLLVFVSAGHPRSSLNNARVDHKGNPGGGLLPQHRSRG